MKAVSVDFRGRRASLIFDSGVDHGSSGRFTGLAFCGPSFVLRCLNPCGQFYGEMLQEYIPSVVDLAVSYWQGDTSDDKLRFKYVWNTILPKVTN